MKIIIAGDFAPCDRLANKVETRQFGDIFPQDIVDIIRSADYSLVNFESPVADKSFKPITKCGPNLGCTVDAVDVIKYIGFKGVTLANNHILDFGVNGLQKTVDCCKTASLDTVGVGTNLKDAEHILYVKQNEEMLAIINCCEHEFSIATDDSAGANPLNPMRQYYVIQEARKNADYVLVIIHGGHEYFQLPSLRMQETYRFFIDAGANVVVNHHQHCYSGYELYNDKPIFYGLGNFCFDHPSFRNSFWNEGFILELSFDRQCVSFKLFPYVQCNESPCVRLLSQKERNNFEKTICSLNDIIVDKHRLKEEVNRYYIKSSKYEMLMLEPYSGRLLQLLYFKGLLPCFINRKKLSAVLNHIKCESHRDKLLFAMALKNK